MRGLSSLLFVGFFFFSPFELLPPFVRLFMFNDETADGTHFRFVVFPAKRSQRDRDF
jgi:hypothetical protein